MTRTRKLIRTFLASVFLYSMTVYGFKIEEPMLGLLALLLVILYYKLDTDW